MRLCAVSAMEYCHRAKFDPRFACSLSSRTTTQESPSRDLRNTQSTEIQCERASLYKDDPRETARARVIRVLIDRPILCL